MQIRLGVRWRESCTAFASACHRLASRNSDYFAHISRSSFLSSKPRPAPVRFHRLSAQMKLANSDKGDATKWAYRNHRNAPTRRPKHFTKGALSSVGSLKPVIQWYPGHIAKAERSLKESIKMVDVVIEVRDCRIPIATAHPDVPRWIGNKSRVLAMNRADLAPLAARSDWRRHLLENGEQVRFIDAKHGRGVRELKKLAMEASSTVNDKRKSRGLLPRPVRCLVIGYPNVGKSALINRLVGRRTAKSANKPGVTRNFQWVRISDTIELLDMPGIIPAKFVSQDTALRLAICDDIGQAAYDTQLTASLMIDELRRVATSFPGYFEFDTLEKRFRLNPRDMSGEEFLYRTAKTLYNGNEERTAVRLLTEFRAGVLGPAALESPNML
ncbi:50S ribosome-binding GTPase [Gracilaria domingensis]|nr:50S ribosome-binding GTPase [Gracilaria domingensis]